MKEYQEQFEELKKFKNNEEYLEHFINLIKHILSKRTIFVKNSTNDELREDFFNSLKEVFLDIFSNKNMSENIEFIGCGHTSLAFKIGKNVLKVGKVNNNNSKYKEFNCAVPLFLNKTFKVDTREYYTIQLSPYVESVDITEEELYGVYKDLRTEGYIWNDPTFENIGRIVEDIETENHTYKKGDLVIRDLEDFAYVGEDTPDIVLDEIGYNSYNSRTYRFETRYLEEKGKTI